MMRAKTRASRSLGVAVFVLVVVVMRTSVNVTLMIDMQGRYRCACRHCDPSDCSLTVGGSSLETSPTNPHMRRYEYLKRRL
jgi:hypothetical protein